MTLRRYAVIFNGPPGSGKDFAVEYLNISPNTAHVTMKQKLLEIASIIHNIDFFAIWEDGRKKDEPMKELDGVTPRQEVIRISEEVIKPHYGQEYFGKCAAQSIQDLSDAGVANVFLFSDGGFIDEILPITEVVDEVILIHLSREGCDFSDDSRDYVDYNELADRSRGAVVKLRHIENCGTDAFYEKLVTQVEEGQIV